MSCGCNNKCNNTGTIVCGSTGKLQEEVKHEIYDESNQVIIKGTCSKTKIEGMLTTADDSTWTQIFIPEILCVPEKKPDIEQLLSLSSCVKIISQRVIKTPVLKNVVAGVTVDVPVENEEGTKLTGRKLIIEGVLTQKVMYVADVASQSVHSAHFDVPFSTFIVLPEATNLTTKYKIDVCIEDIFVTNITRRQIFKNITIFIKATPLVCA